MKRRDLLLGLAATLARAAAKLPANKNVRWALGANLWNYFPPVPFTDILDVMRDTGFIGIRLTQFPGILDKYGITEADLHRELDRRGLHVATISFNGPAWDPAQESKILADARRDMEFLKRMGANHLVVFSPNRKPENLNDAAFRAMCTCFNHIGETAGELGFRAGLHNHLGQMVESPAELARCMELTDPKVFNFSPDTAHLHLAGHDVPQTFERYKSRLVFMDYKDAKWTEPANSAAKNAKFLASIYDLGDGEIDFPACHRVLKQIGYSGWNCVDLDTARAGPRRSYERCGAYIVNKLEPIYA